MILNPDQLKLLLQFQRQEVTGSIVYRRLAKREKDTKNQRVLHRIADEELNHYNIYKVLTQKEVKPNRWQIVKYSLFATLLGPTFGNKLMEKNEGLLLRKFMGIEI